MPSAEQQRLLTYMIISSGAKGIVYYSFGAIQDDWLGLGRRNEIGICWHELMPLEEIIAAGKRGQAERVSREDVEATTYTRAGDTVLFLIKHKQTFNRFVDDATVDSVEVQVPRVPGVTNAKAYLVAYPAVSELPLGTQAPEGSVSLRIPRFDLTALVLITAGSERIEAVRGRLTASLPAVARMSFDVLRDTRAKADVVFGKIGSFTSPAATESMAEGERLFQRARSLCGKEDHARLFVLCREGLAPYRRFRALAVAEAERCIAEQGFPEPARVYANVYFALPKFYEKYRSGPPVRPDELYREALRRLAPGSRQH